MNVPAEIATPASIAAVLESDLRSGVPQRRSIDSRALVTSPSFPTTLASFITPTVVEGSSAHITKVSKTAQPVSVVAAGAVKPVAVEISTESVDLKKFAGRATYHLETSRANAGLEAALYSALAGQALSAFESACMTELTLGGTSVSYSAGKLLDGVFEGFATVIAGGGRPSVIVVHPADLPTLASTFLSSDPGQGIAAGYFAGAAVHISPAQSAGSVTVLDPAGIALLWQADSPMVLVDPYSGSSTNDISIVVDLIAAPRVTNGALVAVVATGTK